MAMLLLAAAARPGAVEVLSVDHGLRAEAAGEVAMVAALCARLGVRHHALALDLADGAKLQARARHARYAAIARAALDRGLMVLATAHHADDQAETLLMRLARGAGLSGLAGVREAQSIAAVPVIRPLLRWRKTDLEQVCRAAGVDWAEDPSNRDPRFERSAMRAAMSGTGLDPAMLARSASHLGEAEAALEWIVEREADRLSIEHGRATLDPGHLPAELARRLLLRAFDALEAPHPRGPDLERAIDALRASRPASLSGLQLAPTHDGRWTLAPEAPRR